MSVRYFFNLFYYFKFPTKTPLWKRCIVFGISVLSYFGERVLLVLYRLFFSSAVIRFFSSIPEIFSCHLLVLSSVQLQCPLLLCVGGGGGGGAVQYQFTDHYRNSTALSGSLRIHFVFSK